VVVHIRFTSEGPLFFLQCLTASTARPSRARGLYQRRYIYIRVCIYIRLGERRKKKRQMVCVCVCVLCIYLHASGHPSKRRAAASASRPFFIGAVMLGAS
jgi:hypothetical protein